ERTLDDRMTESSWLMKSSMNGYMKNGGPGSQGLFIGQRELLMWVSDSSGRAPERIDQSTIYWGFPTLGHVWSRDGRYLYYDVMVDPTFKKEPYWETWRIDLNVGRAEKMPWDGRVVMDTSSDGRWVITIQTHS